MRIEFLPWYQPGADLVRCSGDEGCGALLMNGDAEVHLKWHERIERMRQTSPKKGTHDPLDMPS